MDLAIYQCCIAIPIIAFYGFFASLVEIAYFEFVSLSLYQFFYGSLTYVICADCCGLVNQTKQYNE